MIGHCNSGNRLVKSNVLKESLNIFIPFLYNHRFGVLKDIDPALNMEEIVAGLIFPNSPIITVKKATRMLYKGKPSRNILLCFNGPVKPNDCLLWNLKFV